MVSVEGRRGVSGLYLQDTWDLHITPWEKGRRRWENHHGVPSCVFAMFEGLRGGDPFQSQKVSQTNIIT